MPISMVVGMLISVSTSHFTFSRRISRCRIQGSAITLSASVSAAEPYRWFCPVSQATSSVDRNSAKPCAANRLMRERMRRCDEHREREQQQHRGEQVDELGAVVQHGRQLSAPAARGPASRAPRAGTRCRGIRARGRCASWRAASRSARAARRRWRACASSAGSASDDAEPVAARGDAEREEERQADAGVDEQLQARRPLDHRQVARRNTPAPSPRGSWSVPGASPGCPPGCARSRPATPW